MNGRELAVHGERRDQITCWMCRGWVWRRGRSVAEAQRDALKESPHMSQSRLGGLALPTATGSR